MNEQRHCLECERSEHAKNSERSELFATFIIVPLVLRLRTHMCACTRSLYTRERFALFYLNIWNCQKLLITSQLKRDTMSKTQFDIRLYNEMYQMVKIAKSQDVKLHAESLRDHFEIPDRTARYYFFMIDNQIRKEGESYLHKGENRLIISDIHAPFVKVGFLEHCIKVYHDFNCTQVTFIGDVLDQHFPSAYDVDPDGMSHKDETAMARAVLQPWYNAFPDAEVCIGNHDQRVHTQAFKAGIAKEWIRDYSDVMETPGWNWQESFDHFGVRYVHGHGPGGGNNGAYNRMLHWDMSVVQGHWHTSSFTRWKVSESVRLFGMQLGCGIDIKAYAMAYGKTSMKKPVIECAVVLDNGRLPIHIPMYL